MTPLVLIIFNLNGKLIEIHPTGTAPKIDGYIEELWQNCDSVYNFVQSHPDEGSEPSENTVVYITYDDKNLYLAFRCWALNQKVIANFGTVQDFVKIFIDPFRSRTMAYYFVIAASGEQSEGMILENGRLSDDSWETVWYTAVKIYENRYEIEVKIPFNSIRYKKGITEWGIDFGRFLANRQEYDFWTRVTQKEGHLVSNYGLLKFTNTWTFISHFELYPEVLMRYNKKDTTSGRLNPRASLNLKWDITPQTTINATAFPDFAQIESDPFTLNLSRYSIHLSEQRPFFVESSEMFRLTDLGEEYFLPLDIFYSRQIGKIVNGEPVPILCGLKLAARRERYEIGGLSAYTDSLLTEPKRGFGVLRVKRAFFTNSEFGMLVSGTIAHKNDYNYAVGFDGAYRSGYTQFNLQTVMGEKAGKRDWAISSGGMGFISNFLLGGGIHVIGDSFDVSDIGYVPWAGEKHLQFICGPLKQYSQGSLQQIFIGPACKIAQEPGDTLNWSKILSLKVNPIFRGGSTANLEFSVGENYESYIKYFYRDFLFTLGMKKPKSSMNLEFNYCYSYNYLAGYLAYQGMNRLSVEYRIIPQVLLGLSLKSWIEWDSTENILRITLVPTPRIHFTFTPKIKLRIFNEFVFNTPGTDFGRTEYLSNRFGFLFSYNFKPKSWLYIALNDYRANQGQGLALQNQIGAIKAKYLIYF